MASPKSTAKPTTAKGEKQSPATPPRAPKAQSDNATLHTLERELKLANDALRYKEHVIADLFALKDHLEAQIRHYETSKSWRLTAPLRLSRRVAGALRHELHPKNLWEYTRTAFRIYQNYGVRELGRCIQAKFKLTKSLQEYTRWLAQYDTLMEGDRIAIRKHIGTFSYKPLISIVMPVYNVDGVWLREAIESLRRQLYDNWELCIADDCSPAAHIKPLLKEYMAKDPRIKVVFRETNGHISEASNSALKLATGEFVGLLDHDDSLTEHALYYVVEHLNRQPNLDLLYSDEDKVDETNFRFSPYFKTEWSEELVYGNNSFCHFGVYRRTLLEKIGGFRKGFEGSQDYDLILRSIKRTDASRIAHIPVILYHWRAITGSTARCSSSKDYTVQASLKALGEHFAGSGVEILEGRSPNHFRQVWPLPKKAPKVSIIIPTRNGKALLQQCLESLRSVTHYPEEALEIIVVDNQSDESETLHYLASEAEQKRITLLKYDEPFNFSAINNMAAKHATGEVLCFLNNDIEITQSDWLREMVSQALRKDVGAVGAKLYYPDGYVQHGGILLGSGAPSHAVAGHYFHRLSANDPGYFGRAFNVQSIEAVTAACMVLRKEVFEEVGGFDALHLAVAFNDVELCLRIRKAGYKIIWTPYAELVHHESATRGSDLEGEKRERFFREVYYMRENYGHMLDYDRSYNPNLALHGTIFSMAFPPRLQKPWLPWKN